MNEKTMRIFMATLGVLVGGLSVGLFKAADFGVDPFQCLMAGLANVVPVNFGTLYAIVNFSMLIVIFFVARHYVGIATFVNIFLLGYVVDFSHKTLLLCFPDPSLALRIGFLVLGIVILCFASAVYFTANLGVSTYDAVALFLAEKKIAKFRYCRIGCDLICVGAGLTMGAIPGVGTVVTAFFMGPLIDVFRTKVSEPWIAQFATKNKFNSAAE